MKTYEMLFDVKLWAGVRVKGDADNKKEALARAREAIRQNVDTVDLGMVIEEQGMTVTLTEASSEGDFDLVELTEDGEDILDA